MIDSRNINDLNPILKVLIERFLEIATEKGLKVGISNTYRDIEKQNALYAQGRTKPGSIVTGVKGGYSYHNWQLAVDIVPLNAKGNLSWPEYYPWVQLGEIGESLGLEWGGRWTNPVDRPHYQLTFGYTCTNFVNGTQIPQTIKIGCKDTRLVKFIQGLLGVEQDGIFGEKTKAKAVEYNPTGEIDAKTLKSLITAHINKEAYKTMEQVKTTSETRYNKLSEVPEWGKATIQKLVEEKSLSGDGNGLDLSRDMVRTLTILDRRGKL